MTLRRNLHVLQQVTGKRGNVQPINGILTAVSTEETFKLSSPSACTATFDRSSESQTHPFEELRPASSFHPADSSLPLATHPSSGSQRSSSKRKPELVEPRAKLKRQKSGQTKLSSFFTKTPVAQKAPKRSFSFAVEDAPSDCVQEFLPSSSPPNLQHDLHLTSPPVVLQECDSSPSQQVQSTWEKKSTWSQLLAPIQPPKCTVHGEPAKELTVNKPGPNKGKNFFICSR